MPYGKPRTYAQRKARHRRIFGSLKSFPAKRRGRFGNPISKRARYRYRVTGKGRRQRLAFVNNNVVEIVGQKKLKGKWKETYRKFF